MLEHVTVEGNVEAAAAGDRDAFARLVAQHKSAVATLALAYTADVQASEDIAQDVFVSAWTELPRLRERKAFAAWLLECARNRSRDFLRRRALAPIPTEPDALARSADSRPTPEDAVAHEADRRLVEESLESLSMEDREAILLFHREGLSTAEIARRLGWSDDLARQRLSRARKTLRCVLEARLRCALLATLPGTSFDDAVLSSIEAMSRPVPARSTGAARVRALVATASAAMALLVALTFLLPANPVSASGVAFAAGDAGGAGGVLADRRSVTPEGRVARPFPTMRAAPQAASAPVSREAATGVIGGFLAAADGSVRDVPADVCLESAEGARCTPLEAGRFRMTGLNAGAYDLWIEGAIVAGDPVQSLELPEGAEIVVAFLPPSEGPEVIPPPTKSLVEMRAPGWCDLHPVECWGDRPPSPLHGRVVDTEGAPIGGAKVIVEVCWLPKIWYGPAGRTDGYGIEVDGELEHTFSSTDGTFLLEHLPDLSRCELRVAIGDTAAAGEGVPGGPVATLVFPAY